MDHKLVAVSPDQRHVVIDTFSFPSCCSCHVQRGSHWRRHVHRGGGDNSVTDDLDNVDVVEGDEDSVGHTEHAHDSAIRVAVMETMMFTVLYFGANF